MIKGGAFVRMQGGLELSLPLTISLLFRPDTSGANWTSVLTMHNFATGCAAGSQCSSYFALVQPSAGGMYGAHFQPYYGMHPNFPPPSGNSIVPAASTTAVAAGTWMRVTVVFAASSTVSGAATMALYRDATLIATGAWKALKSFLGLYYTPGCAASSLLSSAVRVTEPAVYIPRHFPLALPNPTHPQPPWVASSPSTRPTPSSAPPSAPTPRRRLKAPSPRSQRTAAL